MLQLLIYQDLQLTQYRSFSSEAVTLPEEIIRNYTLLHTQKAN